MSPRLRDYEDDLHTGGVHWDTVWLEPTSSLNSRGLCAGL